MIRAGLCTLLTLALGACSNTGDTVFDIRKTLFPGDQEFVQRYQTAAQAQAPQLKLLLVEFDEASLISQDSVRDGIVTWITPDGGTLGTKDGFLVTTNGFGIGLLSSDVEEPRAMIASGVEGPSTRFHTYLNGNDRTTTRTYKCVIKNQGFQDIVLGNDPTQGQTVRTFIWSEDCQSLDQKFQNLYWVVPGSNRIVQTVQWTGEFVGEVATQVVP
ncbi:MAG: YjbF family lipoprotein [Paracoccaceae bacterium]